MDVEDFAKLIEPRLIAMRSRILDSRLPVATVDELLNELVAILEWTKPKPV